MNTSGLRQDGWQGAQLLRMLSFALVMAVTVYVILDIEYRAWV